MKITDVKVFPVDEDKLKAYATITFDNCFIVRDLKVISGNKGYFIAMPSKKRKDGTFRDVAHPLNSETRKMIEDAVLQVYEKENIPARPASSYHDEEVRDAQSQGTEYETSESEETLGEDLSSEESEVSGEEEDLAGEEEASTEETQNQEPDQPEEREKRAEENPVIEPSDDPEKAFGYEE